MKKTAYRWIGLASVNSAVSSGASGFSAVHAAGVGILPAAAVSVAVNTRALTDLNSAYGPYTAVLGPAAATAAGYLGNAHGTAPAAVSVALAVLARSAASRKGKRK